MGEAGRRREVLMREAESGRTVVGREEAGMSGLAGWSPWFRSRAFSSSFLHSFRMYLTWPRRKGGEHRAASWYFVNSNQMVFISGITVALVIVL